MSTHSYIAIENKDGSINAVYCHFDGYIKGGVGETLFKHYNKRKLVKQLISHGEISSLGNTINDTDFYHSDYRGQPLVINHYKNKDDFKKALSLIKREVYNMKKGKFSDDDIIKAKITYVNSLKELEDNNFIKNNLLVFEMSMLIASVIIFLTTTNY